MTRRGPRSPRPARQRQPRAAPASRRATHRATTVSTPAATPAASVSRLGFSCFRLVMTFDRAPHEPAYTAVRLRETRNTMGVFAFGARR